MGKRIFFSDRSTESGFATWLLPRYDRLLRRVHSGESPPKSTVKYLGQVNIGLWVLWLITLCWHMSLTFFYWTLVLVIWQAFIFILSYKAGFYILKVYTHICGIRAHARMLGWLSLSNICVCSWKMLRGGQRGLNQWLRETLSEPTSFQVIKRIQTFDNSCSCLTWTILGSLNNLFCVAILF